LPRDWAIPVDRSPDGRDLREQLAQVRPLRALAFALLLAPALTVAARAAAPAGSVHERARTTVADCAAAAPAQHVGLVQLEQDCPGLGAALAQLGLSDSLAEGVADHVDAGALAALLTATREPAQRGPDPAQVGAVLAELEGKPQELSWWQRLRSWLQRLLTPREGGASSWFTNWLERLSPGELLREIVVWTVMGLIVVAAIVVLVREVRASGLRWTGLSRRGSGQLQSAGSRAAAGEAAVEWRQLELAQRPAALFRHIAAQLSAAGRLPPPRGYTHRELRQRARLDAPAERAAWQALARAAERQIYAPQRLSDAEAGQTVADAARIWDPEGPPR
jgi:hypothetical protein